MSKKGVTRKLKNIWNIHNRAYYLSLAIVIILAIVGMLVIAIDKFKTDEEILSLGEPFPKRLEVETWPERELFKSMSGGTAYIRGEVTDRNSECERDGKCSLTVRVNKQRFVLVYNEGDAVCKNTQVAAWVMWDKNVRKGSFVQAYGALGRGNTITFCDSADFFIRREVDPVVTGPVTKLYSDEMQNESKSR